MQVLHVTDTFLPKIGGAEIALDQLARAMTDAGQSCAVLAPRVRGVPNDIDVPYPLRRFGRARSAHWAGWRLCAHIRAAERRLGRFDVLIGHHAFPPGYACVRHARRTGRPSIVYPRGGDIYEVSRFRKKPHAWRKLTYALAAASAVVCASAAMEEAVRKIIGVSAARGRLVRIPNGVNVAEFRADCSASKFASDGRLAGPFVLGLGRVIARKGFGLLIDAFAALSSDAGGRDWRLVIAGDGRELESLRERAKPLGERALLTGMVGGADKRWLLQHCQFLAAPSLEESFGNVALEAMACGKPVIASRASGFAEIVRDGENGLLVEVGSVESLRRALEMCRRSDLSAHSAAATATAEAFSWQRIAGQYAQLIERVTKL